MSEEFVTSEQSLALKELGFDEECMAGYDKEDNTLYIAYLINAGVLFNSHYYDKAPLKQQVFRWFREKYDAHMHPSRLMRNIYVVRYGDWDSEAFKTYEEAENACIDKLIEIAKQQDNGK